MSMYPSPSVNGSRKPPRCRSCEQVSRALSRSSLAVPGGVYPFLKRFLDVVLAASLLLLAAPVLLLILLLVRLTSAGPALYRQVRVGQGGRLFTLYKVRTMIHECEKLTGPCWSSPGDWRVTPLGRWLRRWHLDELPQLWNVLRGEMSLVGPRPERPEFIPHLEQAIPHYTTRLSVPPGLTGLAQLQLPPDTDLESVRRKLTYDLYYISHMSFWLDTRLLLGTVLKLLGGSPAFLCHWLRLPDGAQAEAVYASLGPASGDTDELPTPGDTGELPATGSLAS